MKRSLSSWRDDVQLSFGAAVLQLSVYLFRSKEVSFNDFSF
jgi:hypothetical protein